MDKKNNSEKIFNSMKKGLGQFYKAAKSSVNSQESLLKKEIDGLKNLKIEGRRYVQSKIHAEGGMKMILRSTDRLTRREIAIAKMKEDTLDNNSLKTFLHEARILARLDHPNIVPLHDIGIDPGGEPYFTMKLLSGESLGAVLKKLSKGDQTYLQKYNLNILLEIFLKVCDAAAFAHSRNIVHRDLKPENIQVGDYGEVLLCDWGLAKDINLPEESNEEINLTEILSRQTMHGMIKGTPGFMAPEQVEGNPEITEKTDIYALGCILYNLVTYHRPIESKSLEELVKDTLEGNIIPASERSLNHVPKALEPVMQKAMSVDPKKRYKNSEALACEVRAYLDGFATKAQNADFRTQLHLLINRHKAISSSILISFMLISIIVTSFMIKLTERENDAIFALKEAERRKVEKDKLGKMVAPEFLLKALNEFRDHKYDNALKSAKLAQVLDDTLDDPQILIGRIQFGKMDFDKAAKTFSTNSNTLRQERLFNLSKKYAQKKNVRIIQLIADLTKINEQKIIPGIMQTFNSSQSTEVQTKTVQEIYKKFHKKANAPVVTLKNNATTLKVLYTKKNKSYIRHLNFFKGMKLTSVDISKTKIYDISALDGMPVKTLIISRTPLRAKQIPRNSPLEELDISYTKISELSSLTHLPIKKLNITNAPIRKLAQLEDFPELKYLTLSARQAKPHLLATLRAKGILVEIIPK